MVLGARNRRNCFDKTTQRTRLMKPGDYTYVPSCKGKRLVYLTVTPKMQCQANVYCQNLLAKEN